MPIFIALLIFYSALSDYQEPQTPLNITVKNIKSDVGYIMIAVYDNKEDFLKVPFRAFRTPVDGQDFLSVTMDSLPHGQYSVSIFHDENENKELDTNFFGIPKEAFGFSNNKMGVMGPPSFEDCLISFTSESNKTDIELKRLF